MIDNDILFFQSLRNYLVEFADSVGSAQEFKASIENTSGMNFSSFFSEWYYGEGFPKYSTRWNSVGDDLLIEISHTASKPIVTPTFTNPIEILFTRVSGIDTTIRFDINSNLDQFFIPNIGAVSGIGAIDPRNWVINNTGTNVNDLTFVANLETLDESNELFIYPNPSNGKFSVEMNIAGCYFAELTDLNGNLLLGHSFESNLEFDIEDCAQGIYLLKIIELEKHTEVVRRIIKF